MSRAITAALGDAQAGTGGIRGRGNTASFTQAVLQQLRKWPGGFPEP
jgi:3-isopropylmalate dehydrogenase